MPATEAPVQVTKVCTGFGEEKPATTEYFYANASYALGVSSRCKPCKRAYQREYYKNNPEAKRKRNRTYRIRKYGIEPEDYHRMVEEQAGVCAICGSSPSHPNLTIDHDHHTGEVRGLLCHKCNKGLGLLGDDLDGIESALQYLEAARG